MFIFSLIGSIRIAKKMRDIGIFVHIIDISFNPLFSRISRIPKIMKIIISFVMLINRHSFDVINLNLANARFYGRIASLFSKKTIIVSTIHGFEMKNENITGYIDDFTVCVSNSVKNYFISNSKKTNVKTICNGIDLKKIGNISNDKLYLHKELGLSPKTRIIGMVAYFYNIHSKGHKVFLDAAKIICQKFDFVKFAIVGSDIHGGRYEKYFQDYAKKIGVEKNVYFLGEREDALSLMGSFYIHVLPTQTEGCPMVIIEAMSKMTPNIASDIDPIKEMIIDGKSGFLFEKGNSYSLAKKIEVLLNNPGLAKEMAISGYKQLENNFNSQRMVFEYEKLFKELCFKKPKRNRMLKIVKFSLFFSSFIIYDNLRRCLRFTKKGIK